MLQGGERVTGEVSTHPATQPHAGSPGPTFQDGGGFQHLLLNPRVLPTDGRQKLQDQLRALRLPCPRLPAVGETQGGADPSQPALALSYGPSAPGCFPRPICKVG